MPQRCAFIRFPDRSALSGFIHNSQDGEERLLRANPSLTLLRVTEWSQHGYHDQTNDCICHSIRRQNLVETDLVMHSK